MTKPCAMTKLNTRDSYISHTELDYGLVLYSTDTTKTVRISNSNSNYLNLKHHSITNFMVMDDFSFSILITIDQLTVSSVFL